MPHHPGTAGMEIENLYNVSKGTGQNQKFVPERKEPDPKFENPSRMEVHFPVPFCSLSISDELIQRRVPREPQFSSKKSPVIAECSLKSFKKVARVLERPVSPAFFYVPASFR